LCRWFDSSSGHHISQFILNFNVDGALELVLGQAALLSSTDSLIPNQKTIDAIKEAEFGQLKSFKTIRALIDDLTNESD
jgi:hypothetical protein